MALLGRYNSLQIVKHVDFGLYLDGGADGEILLPGRYIPKNAETEVDDWLTQRRIARVAADPPTAPGATHPGGWRRLTYIRLHGSPRMYYSAYEQPFISALSRRLRAQTGPVWCIFDNTAAGAALGDALATVEKTGPTLA